MTATKAPNLSHVETVVLASLRELTSVLGRGVAAEDVANHVEHRTGQSMSREKTRLVLLDLRTAGLAHHRKGRYRDWMAVADCAISR